MAEDKEKSAAAVDYRKLGKDVFEFFTHRTAYNSAAYLIPTLERMKQENPRLRLLDVGAGAGSVSATFAQIIGPEGHVVCTDLAPSVLPQAEAFAESLGVKNIEFKTADVHQLPFENDSFDVVHCHQLFGHIKDPVAALREMLRVTKPGGVVAAREGDRETEIIWPPLPGLKKWHEYVFDSKVAQVHGGTLTAGRQLLAWALEAGVKRNQIEVSYGTWLTSEEATKMVYARGISKVLNGPSRKNALQFGLTEEDIDEICRDTLAWADREDSTWLMLQTEIIVRK
ncbi:S-adenosyl-L-methionine-dependent methyltransferase [Canariomyces notabilis]|uniref:S-adenosyl-L-methionine-dependent methyltransferase n=1 Tax=Canariomyces notabilis TaxID=2074819 RepID=A0AAN6TAQ4_9PEZI|nr:S-adenosyl-L-methionine-dependent methyltransferase [Canariomyces arenarius]